MQLPRAAMSFKKSNHEDTEVLLEGKYVNGVTGLDSVACKGPVAFVKRSRATMSLILHGQ